MFFIDHIFASDMSDSEIKVICIIKSFLMFNNYLICSLSIQDVMKDQVFFNTLLIRNFILTHLVVYLEGSGSLP